MDNQSIHSVPVCPSKRVMAAGFTVTVICENRVTRLKPVVSLIFNCKL